MKIGCLGDIVFEVSNEVIKTIRDISWSGSVSIAPHSLHLGNTLQEFTGTNADSFDFKFRVSSFAGANPISEIEKLCKYERSGKPVSLIIGSKAYGRYRWLIQKHKITFEHYDRSGNLIDADISVSLIEYLKE